MIESLQKISNQARREREIANAKQFNVRVESAIRSLRDNMEMAARGGDTSIVVLDFQGPSHWWRNEPTLPYQLSGFNSVCSAIRAAGAKSVIYCGSSYGTEIYHFQIQASWG